MLRTFYIRFQGDQYEVVADLFDGIKSVTVYRDNCCAVGSPLESEDIPKEVVDDADKQIRRWLKTL